MVSSSLFNAAVEITSRTWKIQPVRDIRMPEFNAQRTVTVDALWTDGGLRPNSNNLAFLIQDVSNSEDLERWKQRLRAWPIRGGLFVSDELYLLQARSSSSGELEQQTLNLNSWRESLVSPKPHLFTPKALAQLRSGQLSLADLEESVSERSFTFLLRQQEQLDEAFQKGIDAALRTIKAAEGSGSSRAEIQGHVIRFAIAYLAARILQDKNFFGSGDNIQVEDPITLLDRMVTLTNGFFKRARDSAQYVPDPVRQELANYMGYRVSFVLTDHRDVGRLYERAVKRLPRELSGEDWKDLKRHYTPVQIAERMLAALPLEQLRPKDRVIFDPAAGSGSLLLAATSRLAGMTDIPQGDERKLYLRNHVLGNDLDRYADLITQLRYFLASESLGIASETPSIADVLPFPSYFTNEDYEELTQESLPIKPSVIVANPPFAEEGNIQKSARFIEQTTSWLKEGNQFAFVLPSSFLTSKSHGVQNIRRSLFENCEIFEVWQCPEGTVGVDARQDVCLIIGSIGKLRNQYTISRAVVSRAEAFAIRESGFLGSAWISEINSDDWSNLVTKPISINVPTIPLGNIFFVFNGVTHRKGIPPTEECPNGSICKPTWRMRWRNKDSIWADPQRIDTKMRWVIYGSNSLHRAALDVSNLFDLPKILVGRIANRASESPLTVQLDTVGFCPNNSIWCILPAREAERINKGYSFDQEPENWANLSFEEQRLWLLGILASKLGAELSMSGRGTVNLTENILCQFPLPSVVDQRIINITSRLVERDQNRSPIPDPDPLRQELNSLVEESYGNPNLITLQRTGISPELEAWQSERKKLTITVIGQVLEVSKEKDLVFLYLSGLIDDTEEAWIPLPQNLPGWALDGTPFEAELSHDIETFDELRKRPWALRRFQHTPRPYLTNDELSEALKIPSLEIRS